MMEHLFVKSVYSVFQPLFIVIGCVCAYMYLTSASRSKMRLPPGPRCWPFLGNLHQLRGKHGFYYKLLTFRQTYGDIFRLQMGKHNVIFIFGHKYIRELLCMKGELLTRRPNWLYIPDNLLQKKGIVWSNGAEWKNMQSFLESAQHTPSVIKAVEEHLVEEIEVFRNYMTNKSNPFSIEQMLIQATFNYLAAFLLGKRYDHADETMIDMRKKIENFGNMMATARIENYLPNVSLLTKRKLSEAKTHQESVFDTFHDVIEEKKRREVNQEPRDLLDLYLSMSAEDRQRIGTDRELLRTIMDMFVAGRDNMIVSCKWILMCLVKYEEVQSQCRAEIHKVVGLDRRVSSKDRTNTPYMVATIKEIQRMHSPVTLTPFHVADSDIRVDDYDIPKDSLIMFECRAPGKDHTIWKDPEVFNPERFINQSEETLPSGCYIPYGVGPRYCIGKYIGSLFLYDFAANIVQNFKITKKNPAVPLSFDNCFNFFGLHPYHFNEVILESLRLE